IIDFHRVNDGLGVYGDIDKLCFNVKEQRRLNELEAFIDQRCRVQSIHLPHRPCRVRSSLLRGDLPHLLPAPTEKRPTGGSQHQARQLPSLPGAKTLRHGRVLWIHWNQLPRLDLVHYYGTTCDHCLRICRSQNFPRLNRCQRGLQPHRPDQRVKNGSCLVLSNQLSSARDHCPTQCISNLGCCLGISYCPTVRRKVNCASLLHDEVRVCSTCGDDNDLEFIAIIRNHLERLGAN